jgi:NADPH-dependent 2,4-dienoyl-CoA reductase/sulfur reductase-like enzyme
MRWRYALHSAHVEGRLALQFGEPGPALMQPKIEARALVLAGEAFRDGRAPGRPRRAVSRMNELVLVVGAGPVGLTMAMALKRRGVDVRIVDKAPLWRVDQARHCRPL